MFCAVLQLKQQARYIDCGSCSSFGFVLFPFAHIFFCIYSSCCYWCVFFKTHPGLPLSSVSKLNQFCVQGKFLNLCLYISYRATTLSVRFYLCSLLKLTDRCRFRTTFSIRPIETFHYTWNSDCTSMCITQLYESNCRQLSFNSNSFCWGSDWLNSIFSSLPNWITSRWNSHSRNGMMSL